jgi:hypothetical protein
MNCKNKSEMFADYLIQIGANNVYLVVIEHNSEKYSHEVVEGMDISMMHVIKKN